MQDSYFENHYKIQHHEPLEFGKYYHIYNRGINSCNLFKEEENYRYFRQLYKKHISPIATTLAWVLMPNHFHFLVRINEPPLTLSGFQTLTGLKPPHQSFSNLFNAYTQAFNKRYGRHGGLFERPFRRKLIEDDEYMKTLIVYIHTNPVHHSFCYHPGDYRWSSYNDYLTSDINCVPIVEAINLFGDLDNFTYFHNEKVVLDMIDEKK